ncbi:MAG: protein-disulfide reductase DsbD [Candidatus Marinimicrobia bacterium]|nr:protein-disulfide reductase DsbD [Candidatus Neomarinimicrobiota bacterium]MCF7830011.1 protein-disulfide reductase DsbD [Candidatus Neomarinimicrobiota bacterium]MCF7881947.1 protein-disulfide reductase DsbD [Candidatus Neomarinimicrobiota bacterium]
MRNITGKLLALFLLLPITLFAQFDVPENIVQIEPKWAQNGAVTGESVQLALQVEVEETWHINSNEPLEDFLIPTEVSFQTEDGITTGRVYYPEAHLYNFDFSESEVAVYEGTVNLVTAVSVDQSFTADSLHIVGTLQYQACNNTSCLPPQEKDFTASIPVFADSAQIEEVNQAAFTGVESDIESSGLSSGTDAEISAWMQEKGLFITLLLVFLGGLALNLTPCVYPLIPITVSYFGGQAKGESLKNTFVLALFYVLGMAITYSLLGTVAALTGQMIGAALQNPWVLGFIAIILVALASSMFGAFEITVPQSLASIGGKSRQGLFGSLFMGLTVGIIAAPCIGPFVLSLVIFVGDIGNPALGFTMFFVLSLGLGLPYLVLGTFSGLMQKLPKSGQWMVWVRYVFGFILIGMAIYFLEPVMSGTLYRILHGVNALAGAIYLGAITWSRSDSRAFKIVKPVIGLLFLAFAIWVVIPSKGPEVEIEWQKYSQEKLDQAASQNRPVIIDFYADWCIPCKELDNFTFSNPAVVEEAERFVTLKADLTQNNAPEVQQLKQKYDIRGVPSIVFLNEDGREVESLRLTGFESAEQFLERMNEI